MYNVQDYSVLYNNTVRPIIDEVCTLFTFEKPMHFTKKGGVGL